MPAGKVAELTVQDVDGEPTTGKICTKCAMWKSLASYSPGKHYKGGVMAVCRVCREKFKKPRTEAERLIESERGKSKRRNMTPRERQQHLADRREYDARRKQKLLAAGIVKKKKNKTREQRDEYNRKRRELYNADPLYRLSCILRATLRHNFKNRKKSSFDLTGCTSLQQLQERILANSSPEIANHVTQHGYDGVELDHMISMSTVTPYLDDQDFQDMVCDWRNLRLISRTENRHKQKRSVLPPNEDYRTQYADQINHLRKNGVEFYDVSAFQ